MYFIEFLYPVRCAYKKLTDVPMTIVIDSYFLASYQCSGVPLTLHKHPYLVLPIFSV